MITQYKAADPLDPTSQAEYKLLAGGATRTWVGTEDAYNAEKNNIPNNTMICITDDNMDVDTYSTSEVKTNKIWIDGKPIYRRVVLSATSTSIDITSWGVDTMLSCYGCATYEGDERNFPYFGLNKEIYNWQLTQSQLVCVSVSWANSWTNAKIVCEYTKTAG